MKKKKIDTAVNEFNQTVEGNSLTKDAWRRLKKNKMAVFGMIVVLIYGLISAFASILPIYSYKELVIDHQFLPPSFTKNAGELLEEKMLQDIFARAWKAGTLKVTEEENQMLKTWVKENEVPKVWKWCYEEGIRQVEAGTYTYSSAEQRKLDKFENELKYSILVSVDRLTWQNENGKKINLEKTDFDTIANLYSTISGRDIETIRTQAMKSVRTQIETSVKSQHTDDEITDEELNMLVETEIKAVGENEIDSRMATSVYGNITNIVDNKVHDDITAEIDANENLTWPIKQELDMGYGITAKVNAEKTHERRYILGTDNLGRDLLARIIYGGQISIAIGLVGTLTSVLIGILLGSLAGYIGGKVDTIIMRFVDILYGLPYMLLVIIFMSIFKRGILNLFIALAMISWLTIARMVRGQIMSLKNSEFIEAARSMGASTWRIIFKHLIPNSLSIIIVYSTLRIPVFIMQESFLSFLGLGISAPYCSWGSLVGESVGGLTNYWWRLVFPAITMTLFLFMMNFFGDGLRDAFDPQSKNMI